MGHPHIGVDPSKRSAPGFAVSGDGGTWHDTHRRGSGHVPHVLGVLLCRPLPLDTHPTAPLASARPASCAVRRSSRGGAAPCGNTTPL
eukprot:6039881-Prymnesium_polylepis.1